jgi:hypothetical protein
MLPGIIHWPMRRIIDRHVYGLVRVNTFVQDVRRNLPTGSRRQGTFSGVRDPQNRTF